MLPTSPEDKGGEGRHAFRFAIFHYGNLIIKVGLSIRNFGSDGYGFQMLFLCFLQKCTPEGSKTPPGVIPPPGWPDKGEIIFKNYQMKYRENTPTVLHDINIHIHAKEKIGIIGRTGSGTTYSIDCFVRRTDNEMPVSLWFTQIWE